MNPDSSIISKNSNPNENTSQHSGGEVAPYQLNLSKFTKTYGNVIANNEVDFCIKSGEIKALLGENGAGKSTLVKMICGIVKPDSGKLFWKGKETKIINPKFAKNIGIGMVFQHFSLFDAMSVLDNIAISLNEPYNKANLKNKIKELSQHYGLEVDPSRIVSTLSVGAKQRIEIIRCLMQNPKLLILDEPTAVLTPQEANILFVTLNRLAEEGCAILYISHRLDEVRRLCHSATIMRDGKVVTDITPADNSAGRIAELMLGEKILTPKSKNNITDKVILDIKNLSLDANIELSQIALKNISINLRAGEIYGIAGIAGNGQNELMSALSGEIRTKQLNKILLDNIDIGKKGIAARRELGMGVSYVPEERIGHGAVAEMTLSENILLTTTKEQKLTRFGFIKEHKVNEFAKSIIDKFNVKTESEQTKAAELSGGNLQKFIVGREITQKPKVILAAQPTWGVDAGAASQIQQTLIELAELGCAIILISQDLDEIFSIANSISIMFEGNLSKPYPISEITLEQIGLLMVGESIND